MKILTELKLGNPVQYFSRCKGLIVFSLLSLWVLSAMSLDSSKDSVRASTKALQENVQPVKFEKRKIQLVSRSSSSVSATKASVKGKLNPKGESRDELPLELTAELTVELTVEIAETPEQTARGLMYRTELKDGEGMLFIFDKEQALSFWMKNTFIPLSIGFFNSEGDLVDIQDMQPMRSVMQTDFPNYVSRVPARFALEVPQGWFERRNIKLGARLRGEGLPLVKESRRK